MEQAGVDMKADVEAWRNLSEISVRGQAASSACLGVTLS